MTKKYGNIKIIRKVLIDEQLFEIFIQEERNAVVFKAIEVKIIRSE